MKYIPIYLPADCSDNKDEPVFNTEKEARDWIYERACSCKIKVGDEKFCEACMAEWDVEEIKD